MFKSLIDQLQQPQYIQPKPEYDEKEDIYEDITPPKKYHHRRNKKEESDEEESKEEEDIKSKPKPKEEKPPIQQIQQSPPQSKISKSDLIIKRIDDDKDLRRLALEESSDYSELSESDISDSNGELNGDYSDGELYIYRDGPDIPFHDGPCILIFIIYII